MERANNSEQDDSIIFVDSKKMYKMCIVSIVSSVIAGLIELFIIWFFCNALSTSKDYDLQGHSLDWLFLIGVMALHFIPMVFAWSSYFAAKRMKPIVMNDGLFTYKRKKAYQAARYLFYSVVVSLIINIIFIVAMGILSA